MYNDIYLCFNSSAILLTFSLGFKELNSINNIIFELNMRCVFLVIDTGCLNTIYINFGFKGLSRTPSAVFNQYLTVSTLMKHHMVPMEQIALDVRAVSVEATLHDHQWAVNSPPLPSPLTCA